MEKRLQQLPKLAEEAKKESLKYFANIKRRVPKNFDYVVQELHDAEFKKTDCLDCGNCCKTTSPIFTDKDTERISKYLRMKVADFEKQYLQRDEDNFMVLKTAPCSFLDETDNSCVIYNFRQKLVQNILIKIGKSLNISDLTIANTAICPATYSIVEALKKALPAVSKVKKRRN